MNVTYYLGLPGTGKTTLMRSILAEYRKVEEDEFVVEGPVKYHRFNKQKVIVLGIYDDSTFAGTDRLSKSCPPKFREWVTANKDKYADWHILGEGERFSNNPTLDHLLEHTNLKLVCLKVSEEELERRRQARNNTQSESWLRGMYTRIDNLCQKYPHEVKFI
jgi:hypothetical protein